MKKITFLCFLLVLGLTQNSFAWWTSLYNRGTPVYTYYLGDVLLYQFEFAVNQETSPMTISSGLGKTTDGTDWTWNDAVWSWLDGDNRVWKSNHIDYILTSTGNWYYSGRFVWTENGYTEYASGDWAENRTSLSATSYFLVNPLENPGTLSIEPYDETQINLSWVKWSSKDVMIVRKLSNQDWGVPTPGTAYSVEDLIGEGVVVYHGNGSAYNDLNLTSSTRYNYKLYSINNSYYSSGAELTANTSTSSTDHFRSFAEGDWSTLGTWQSSYNKDEWVASTVIPDLNANSVAIRSGHAVTVSENVTANELTVESGGILQIGNGSSSGFLELSFVNNGTVIFNRGDDITFAYTISGEGDVIKNGDGRLSFDAEMTYTGNTTVASGILWLSQSLPTNTITVEDGATLAIKQLPVTINNMVINVGGVVNVDYAISLTVDGNLTNNGILTLQNMESDAGSSGSLIVIGTVTGTGILDYKLTIEEASAWGTWNSGWHFLSSPVASQAISAFATSGEDNNYDFYGYYEPTRQWVNYKEDPDDDPKFSVWNGPNFVVGRGYLVSYQQLQYNLEFTGAQNNADVHISNLSYNPTQGKGWHLLGNPFSSALKWNDGNWALSSEVAGIAKIWNSADMSYTDIEENGIIPAAQGFYVQVNGAANSLTIPRVARTHENIWYKAENDQEIRLIARPTDGSSAQASIIRINPEASNGFDFYWDSRFIAGGAPKFYSQVNGEKISTNTLKEITTGFEIPFEFESNGHEDYFIELAANDLNSVLVLVDLKTGITHDLTVNPVYIFTASEGDSPNRFLLKFSAVGIDETVITPAINAWVHDNTLFVNNQISPTLIEVFDLMGRAIYNTRLTGNGLQNHPMKLTAGIYMVRINNGSSVKTIKAHIE